MASALFPKTRCAAPASTSGWEARLRHGFLAAGCLAALLLAGCATGENQVAEGGAASEEAGVSAGAQTISADGDVSAEESVPFASYPRNRAPSSGI